MLSIEQQKDSPPTKDDDDKKKPKSKRQSRPSTKQDSSTAFPPKFAFKRKLFFKMRFQSGLKKEKVKKTPKVTKKKKKKKKHKLSLRSLRSKSGKEREFKDETSTWVSCCGDTAVPLSLVPEKEELRCSGCHLENKKRSAYCDTCRHPFKTKRKHRSRSHRKADCRSIGCPSKSVSDLLYRRRSEILSLSTDPTSELAAKIPHHACDESPEAQINLKSKASNVHECEMDIFPFKVSTFKEGRHCVSKDEKQTATNNKASLCFGEVHPAGAKLMFDKDHLDLDNAKHLLDLGMGCGKLILQASIEYPHISATGWELSRSRFELAVQNLRAYETYLGGNYITVVNENKVVFQRKTKDNSRQVITLHCGNMFETDEISTADVVLFQVAFNNHDIYPSICAFLDKIKPGAKLCSYFTAKVFYESVGHAPPFAQLPINVKGDFFCSTWGFAHLYMYRKKLRVLK